MPDSLAQLSETLQGSDHAGTSVFTALNRPVSTLLNLCSIFRACSLATNHSLTLSFAFFLLLVDRLSTEVELDLSESAYILDVLASKGANAPAPTLTLENGFTPNKGGAVPSLTDVPPTLTFTGTEPALSSVYAAVYSYRGPVVHSPPSSPAPAAPASRLTTATDVTEENEETQVSPFPEIPASDALAPHLIRLVPSPLHIEENPAVRPSNTPLITPAPVHNLLRGISGEIERGNCRVFLLGQTPWTEDMEPYMSPLHSSPKPKRASSRRSTATPLLPGSTIRPSEPKAIKDGPASAAGPEPSPLGKPFVPTYQNESSMNVGGIDDASAFAGEDVNVEDTRATFPGSPVRPTRTLSTPINTSAAATSSPSAPSVAFTASSLFSSLDLLLHAACPTLHAAMATQKLPIPAVVWDWASSLFVGLRQPTDEERFRLVQHLLKLSDADVQLATSSDNSNGLSSSDAPLSPLSPISPSSPVAIPGLVTPQRKLPSTPTATGATGGSSQYFSPGALHSSVRRVEDIRETLRRDARVLETVSGEYFTPLVPFTEHGVASRYILLQLLQRGWIAWCEIALAMCKLVEHDLFDSSVSGTESAAIRQTQEKLRELTRHKRRKDRLRTLLKERERVREEVKSGNIGSKKSSPVESLSPMASESAETTTVGVSISVPEPAVTADELDGSTTATVAAATLETALLDSSNASAEFVIFPPTATPPNRVQILKHFRFFPCRTVVDISNVSTILGRLHPLFETGLVGASLAATTSVLISTRLPNYRHDIPPPLPEGVHISCYSCEPLPDRRKNPHTLPHPVHHPEFPPAPRYCTSHTTHVKKGALCACRWDCPVLPYGLAHSTGYAPYLALTAATTAPHLWSGTTPDTAYQAVASSPLQELLALPDSDAVEGTYQLPCSPGVLSTPVNPRSPSATAAATSLTFPGTTGSTQAITDFVPLNSSLRMSLLDAELPHTAADAHTRVGNELFPTYEVAMAAQIPLPEVSLHAETAVETYSNVLLRGMYNAAANTAKRVLVVEKKDKQGTTQKDEKLQNAFEQVGFAPMDGANADSNADSKRSSYSEVPRVIFDELAASHRDLSLGLTQEDESLHDMYQTAPTAPLLPMVVGYPPTTSFTSASTIDDVTSESNTAAFPEEAATAIATAIATAPSPSSWSDRSLWLPAPPATHPAPVYGWTGLLPLPESVPPVARPVKLLFPDNLIHKPEDVVRVIRQYIDTMDSTSLPQPMPFLSPEKPQPKGIVGNLIHSIPDGDAVYVLPANRYGTPLLPPAPREALADGSATLFSTASRFGSPGLVSSPPHRATLPRTPATALKQMSTATPGAKRSSPNTRSVSPSAISSASVTVLDNLGVISTFHPSGLLEPGETVLVPDVSAKPLHSVHAPSLVFPGSPSAGLRSKTERHTSNTYSHNRTRAVTPQPVGANKPTSPPPSGLYSMLSPPSSQKFAPSARVQQQETPVAVPKTPGGLISDVDSLLENLHSPSASSTGGGAYPISPGSIRSPLASPRSPNNRQHPLLTLTNAASANAIVPVIADHDAATALSRYNPFPTAAGLLSYTLDPETEDARTRGYGGIPLPSHIPAGSVAFFSREEDDIQDDLAKSRAVLDVAGPNPFTTVPGAEKETATEYASPATLATLTAHSALSLAHARYRDTAGAYLAGEANALISALPKWDVTGTGNQICHVSSVVKKNSTETQRLSASESTLVPTNGANASSGADHNGNMVALVPVSSVTSTGLIVTPSTPSIDKAAYLLELSLRYPNPEKRLAEDMETRAVPVAAYTTISEPEPASYFDVTSPRPTKFMSKTFVAPSPNTIRSHIHKKPLKTVHPSVSPPRRPLEDFLSAPFPLLEDAAPIPPSLQEPELVKVPCSPSQAFSATFSATSTRSKETLVPYLTPGFPLSSISASSPGTVKNLLAHRTEEDQEVRNWMDYTFASILGEDIQTRTAAMNELSPKPEQGLLDDAQQERLEHEMDRSVYSFASATEGVGEIVQDSIMDSDLEDTRSVGSAVVPIALVDVSNDYNEQAEGPFTTADEADALAPKLEPSTRSHRLLPHVLPLRGLGTVPPMDSMQHQRDFEAERDSLDTGLISRLMKKASGWLSSQEKVDTSCSSVFLSMTPTSTVMPSSTPSAAEEYISYSNPLHMSQLPPHQTTSNSTTSNVTAAAKRSVPDSPLPPRHMSSPSIQRLREHALNSDPMEPLSLSDASDAGHANDRDADASLDSVSETASVAGSVHSKRSGTPSSHRRRTRSKTTTKLVFNRAKWQQPPQQERPLYTGSGLPVDRIRDVTPTRRDRSKSQVRNQVETVQLTHPVPGPQAVPEYGMDVQDSLVSDVEKKLVFDEEVVTKGETDVQEVVANEVVEDMTSTDVGNPAEQYTHDFPAAIPVDPVPIASPSFRQPQFRSKVSLEKLTTTPITFQKALENSAPETPETSPPRTANVSPVQGPQMTDSTENIERSPPKSVTQKSSAFFEVTAHSDAMHAVMNLNDTIASSDMYCDTGKGIIQSARLEMRRRLHKMRKLVHRLY